MFVIFPSRLSPYCQSGSLFHWAPKYVSFDTASTMSCRSFTINDILLVIHLLEAFETTDCSRIPSLERTADVKIKRTFTAFSQSDAHIDRAYDAVHTHENAAGKDGVFQTDVRSVLPRISELDTPSDIHR